MASVLSGTCIAPDPDVATSIVGIDVRLNNIYRSLLEHPKHGLAHIQRDLSRTAHVDLDINVIVLGPLDYVNVLRSLAQSR